MSEDLKADVKADKPRYHEIDLSEQFQKLLKRKILTISITFLSAILSVVQTLQMPNIYIAEAILNPSSSSPNSSKGGNVFSPAPGR